MKRPLIRNQSLAAAGGLLAFAAGWVLLYDAYDRRGRPTPRLLRVITWW